MAEETERLLHGAESEHALHVEAAAGPATSAAQLQHAAGPDGGGDTGGAGAGAGQQQTAPACRICLQEDEAGSLEHGICGCTGSMQWAHFDCIQRWIDEKHDKQCEICGQQFRGSRREFRDPPPRPPPPQPLRAELRIDAASNRRTLLMRDPQTGQVVARVLVPDRTGGGGSGSEDGREDSDEDEDDVWVEEQMRRRSNQGRVLAVILLMCLLGFMLALDDPPQASSHGTGGGGGGGHAGGGSGGGSGSGSSATTTSWLMRVALFTAWIVMHSMHRVPLRYRHAGVALEARHPAHGVDLADLEAGRQWRQRR